MNQPNEEQPIEHNEQKTSAVDQGRRHAIKAGIGAAAVLVTLTSRPTYASTGYVDTVNSQNDNPEAEPKLFDHKEHMARSGANPESNTSA